METQVQMLHYRGLTCMQACLINIADHYHLPYQSVFYEFFSLRVPEPVSVSAINACIRSTTVVENLEAFTGLGIQARDLDNLLGGTPQEDITMLALPLQSCYWIPEAYQLDSAHHILACYNREHNLFYFIDPMFNKNSMKLDRRFLEANVSQVYSVTQTPVQLPGVRQLLQLAQEHLVKYEVETAFTELMKQLRQFFVFTREQNHEIIRSTLNHVERNIGFYLAGSRSIYCEFLAYIQQETGTELFEDIIGLLRLCDQKWTLIRNMLHKNYIKRVIYNDDDSIVGLFDTVRDWEKKIQDELHQIYVKLIAQQEAN